MNNSNIKISEGKPYPLGATWDGKGVNFALFSENAASVTLCLFNNLNSKTEDYQIALQKKSEPVWYRYISGLKPGQLYGFRVSGQYKPSEGLRFNDRKLLLDPYAKAVTGPHDTDPKVYDYKQDIRKQKKTFIKDSDDSAGVSPRSVVIDQTYDWENTGKPFTPFNNSIIYELHTKGFTTLHPGIPERERGTFKALTYPFILNYFKKLGISAIELLPVHHFLHSRFLLDKGLTEYWGYNPIGYFAPHAGYSCSGSSGEQVKEFRDMVKAYHREGIEIILDVVYNHTVEGGPNGPTICFRGIDNSSYYLLNEKYKNRYIDYTGTGNTMNILHPFVLKLVIESLRYWAEDMQVDGFRFDLAPALVRGNRDFSNHSLFLSTIQNDPVLSKVKLIAEPWDHGKGGNRSGKFPKPWSEWSGNYRNAIRKFWRGDDIPFSEISESLTGSKKLFGHKGNEISSSINYITSHDGFTLADLVSYSDKQNNNNLEDNKDGENENYSFHCGKQGPTYDQKINRLRLKQRYNFMATLLLSQGVPMLNHGDEYGRTQQGNNNVYCQDNEVSWFRWNWSEKELMFYETVKKMIHFRKNTPILNNPFYLITNPDNIKEVQWIKTDGTEFDTDEFSEEYIRCFGMILIDRTVKVHESNSSENRLLILFNSSTQTENFILPGDNNLKAWQVILDTGKEVSPGINVSLQSYEINNQSLVLFKGLFNF